MRYLGIDYGSKNIGLALSDPMGSLAFPYKVLRNDLSLIENIVEIVKNEEVSAIVLGESLNSSGEKNKIMESIEEFRKNLEVELDMPIYYQKEFMTSLLSQIGQTKDIFSQRQNKKPTSTRTGPFVQGGKKEIKKDESAASLILQRYLDKLGNRE